MFSPTKKLTIPENFNFPFKPYEIQNDLMKSLYSVIENKQIGIYESPTGTGKSLTLTCGSLRWLLDHEKLIREELILKINEMNKEIEKQEESNNIKIDWIDSQYQTIKKKDEINNLKKINELIQEYDEKMKKLKEKIENNKIDKKKKYLKQSQTENFNNNENLNEKDDLTLSEYEEDDEEDKKIEEINHIKYSDVKIFFCSRTHSQLSQVVNEIKRTEYGNHVRCISLASRQNLCINQSVRKLNSVNLINEKCLDMCKNTHCKTTNKSGPNIQPSKRLKLEKSSSTSTTSKCQYKNQNLIENLRDLSLIDILDIEDLVKEGENLKSCPYYSSRDAIKDAQIIMLPYQMLLHHKTRQQTGINLKNNIVIIDEAHNLIDSITNIYSAEINLFQLKLALKQITAYKNKYFKQFSSKNHLRIYQIQFITKRLCKFFDHIEEKSSSATTRMVKTYELMSEGEFYKINIYHLLEFCDKTRFAQKVHYFSQSNKNVENQIENVVETGVCGVLKKIQEKQLKHKENKLLDNVKLEKENENKEDEKISSVIRPLLTFLETLMECSNDGGVLITYNSTDDKKCGFKYCLQNPGGHFEEIIKDCRSVIIAGGTMQPTDNLTTLLLKNYENRIKLHFFNHVVPQESILPFVVQKGPSGKYLLFNYNQRSNKELLNELGRTLVNVCSVIPAGIVCFVSSYNFLDEIFNHFKNENYIEQISLKKYIFREQQRKTNSTDDILKNYSNAIKSIDKNGAILFSVIGGKLSEGLNFTDDLGRCVIVIGMPFPNKNSPDLLEKMKYLEKTMFNGAGQQYYNNMCMKSVNQCIGRSIRHINDYATVLLLDERYSQEWVQQKLPLWIRKSLRISTNFGSVQSSVAKFFRERRNIQ